ncbi:hypothetical protein FOE78_13115 [Microlunatus elymi]|uniref:Uncharacterized protein n=1 Tax=Microlunatus elymi TaxID=2596828 RepID=A0A516PZX3_9ACTN|nr:hypothetical protein [Microlunatus elymi]QDP96723.1 hypothetical protein FOE78_13115 [Microlunatus elymi]
MLEIPDPTPTRGPENPGFSHDDQMSYPAGSINGDFAAGTTATDCNSIAPDPLLAAAETAD